MSLLPSKPDAEPPDDAGPRVIGVDSEDADDVMAALSSGTARELLSELHEEPAAPSTLANTVETSVQNVKYHLDKLENAGAIEVVDTAYSEKGREMDVYAAADQPLVIYAGDEEKGSTLRTALSRLLGAVGILAVASFVVQAVFEDGVPWADDEPVVDDPDAVDDTDETAVDEAEEPPAEDVEESPEEQEDTPAEESEQPADDGPGIAEEPDDEPQGEPEDEADIAMEEPPAEEDDPDSETIGDDAEMDTADDADVTGDVNETITENATAPEESPVPGPDAFESATEAASALPPGVLFFAGGLFALLLVGGWLYMRQ